MVNKKNICLMSLYLVQTRLNFTTNFLHQNNPKSKYYFDITCDILLNRRMATWNLFVKCKNGLQELKKTKEKSSQVIPNVVAVAQTGFH